MKQDIFESLDVIKIKRTAFEIVFYEDFEGTKGVIKTRKSKKNRQHTGQKKDNTLAKRKGQKDK
jgi:hypothetical protein